MTKVREIPDDWRLPTTATLERNRHALAHGLVPAGDPILSRPAEVVRPEEISGPDVVRALAKMYGVVRAMRDIDRPPLGLAAPQAGEAIRAVLVPRHPGYPDYPEDDDGRSTGMMAVFNPELVLDETVPREPIVHGCFSANEVFVILPSSMAHTLTGLDLKGNPIALKREGWRAAVDEHEERHLRGIRAPDVAAELGIQLDYRPAESTDLYIGHIAAKQSDPTTPDWPEPYPHAQWLAVKAGEFVLADFE